MKKMLITLAALSIAAAPAAFAKESPNATTARLNQQQLSGAPLNVQPEPAPSIAMSAPAPADDTPTTVYIAAPPRDSSDTPPGPDTNPQSTGTPSIDSAYVAVVPAQSGN